eukprot:jgi/Bigna1/85385/estExt_fgenesh1_pg.C_30409
MGVCRLRGHKAPVTGVEFMQKNYLLSCSKDTLVKVWDIEQQFCLQTITLGQGGEAFAIAYCPQMRRVAVGAGDSLIRMYKLRDEDDNEDNKKGDVLTPYGTLQRQSKQRVNGLELELERKLKRRKKRVREKGKDETAVSTEVTAEDEFRALLPLRINTKVRSVCCDKSYTAAAAAEARVLIGTSSNSLQVYKIDLVKAQIDTSKVLSGKEHVMMEKCINLQGHRSGVRNMSGCRKQDQSMHQREESNREGVWNTRSGSCIRTLDGTGYGLCGMFLPGNRHVLIGTKSGDLELYDLTAASLLEKLQAHKGTLLIQYMFRTLWSLHPRPDGKGFVTGGGDKAVKLWEYKVKRSESGSASIGLSLAREMEMTDEVLSVCFSPNGKWLAVGLLDSTIKVMVLSGHHAKVWSLSIAKHGTLLVSSSNDSVYVRKYLKYCDEKIDSNLGADRRNGKNWRKNFDASNENVGAAAPPGKLVGSGLDEPLDSAPVATGADSRSMVGAERLMEAMEVVKLEKQRWAEYHKAVEREKRGEEDGADDDGRGLKALFEAHAGHVKGAAIPEPAKNPVLAGKTSAEYVFTELQGISAAARTDALINLPFKYAGMLLKLCEEILEEKLNTEAVVQTVLFLAATRRDQITQSRELMECVTRLRNQIRRKVRRQRDEIGETIAGFRCKIGAGELQKRQHFYTEDDSSKMEWRGNGVGEDRNASDPFFVIDRRGTAAVAASSKRRKKA